MPSNRHDFSEVSAATLSDDTISAIVRSVAFARPLALVGAPGIGKTMIARRLTSIMEPLSDLEATWLSADYASLGLCERVTERPFRAPHHTISAAAMSGTWQRRHALTCPQAPEHDVAALVSKGIRIRCTCDDNGRPGERYSRPGEATLARFGVLYLDELIEFPRSVIEAARDRLRAMGTTAPLVVASLTPCPCGWHGSTARECVCTPDTVARWTARTAQACAMLGIETRLDLPPVTLADLRTPSRWSSDDLRREVAWERLAGEPGAVGFMRDSDDWSRLAALKAANEEPSS